MYQSRVDYIRGLDGGGGVGAGTNGTYYFNLATVFDDGVKDSLLGGLDSVWFWSFTPDTNDKVPGEDLNMANG